MFSIRKKFCLLAGSMLVATGCQWRQPVKPAAVANEPLPADPAIERRDWPQQTARYANGATVAGPTGYVLQPKLNQPEWTNYYNDFATWAANTVMMPVVLIITPPWTEQIYRGEWVLATYTGQPPLPPQMTPGYVPRGIRPPAATPVTTKSATMTSTARTSTTISSAPMARPSTATVPTPAPKSTVPATRPAAPPQNK